MATEKKLEELFHHTLQDIYYAEKQILKAIPKMAAGAKSPELKKAFEHHKDQTEVHVTRLEDVFKMIGQPAKGVKCDAIEGILKEGEGALEDFGKTISGDAAIIAAAFSAIMMAGALVFPETMVGMIDASATRRRCTPCTRSRSSTTAMLSEPILQVPTG